MTDRADRLLFTALAGRTPPGCRACRTEILDPAGERELDCLPPPDAGQAVGPFCPACAEAHSEGRLRVAVDVEQTGPRTMNGWDLGTGWKRTYRFEVAPRGARGPDGEWRNVYQGEWVPPEDGERDR